MSTGWSRLTADGRPIATRLRRLLFALWLLLVLLSVVTIVAFQSQTSGVDRLTLVIGPANSANSQALQAMTDAEAGLLGYQATGDPGLLAQLHGAEIRMMAALRTVRQTLSKTSSHDGELTGHAALETRQEAAATAWWDYARQTEQAGVDARNRRFAEGKNLFDRFRIVNASLGSLIQAERNRLRDSARATLRQQEIIVAGACLVAMLLGLLGIQRAARAFSRPIGELRTVLRRQREGDVSARARVDIGALEVRSLAEDFNALTELNVGLQQTQARDLSLHELTFEIERAIRAAPNTQQALIALCAPLAEGLGVDRVVAKTIDANHKLLFAQWHRSDLPPLEEAPGDVALPVGQADEEPWRSSERLTLEDFLDPQVQSQERNQIFHRETGARAVLVAPIGLGDRMIGVIYVINVREPRRWTASEASTVQQVAAFVAPVILEAEHRAHQSEYVDRLERLDRQKIDFVATVSHELRTPLTSISGYLEMLRDRDAGDLTVEQARMLEVMDRNTSRLRGLIEDLLVLNRIESGELQIDVAGVSIRELVTHAVHELSPSALAGSIELDIDPVPEAATVLGDKASLGRAVINVVSNAIKFSRPGGAVVIRCTLHEGRRRVLVSCQDRGIGIPAEDQAQLFTRFYRASNATAEAIPGTGLGLSIVKQIVEDHDGELRLSSVEGEGTEVVIDLPWHPLGRTSGSGGNDSQQGDVFDIRA
jgi:signal transduction histidine kinase/CHASE3 domain sensor protein